VAPPPPPKATTVENTLLLPFEPKVALVAPAPPDPTVIVYAVSGNAVNDELAK
jgi:hypothetical protein